MLDDTSSFGRKFFRFTLIAVLSALFALSLRTFGFGLFVIPTSSMAPSLLIGDYLLVTKYSYGFSNIANFNGMLSYTGRVGGHAPQRGDLIVFKMPAGHAPFYMKRLIGLPGDTLRMQRGVLYLNGQPVERERLAQPIWHPNDNEPTADIVDFIEYLPDGPAHYIRVLREMKDEETVNNTGAFTVPPHQYFFMGDNRDNSEDSRVANVGMVPEEMLVGKAKFVVFSLEKGTSFWSFKDWSWAVRWHRLFRKVI